MSAPVELRRIYAVWSIETGRAVGMIGDVPVGHDIACTPRVEVAGSLEHVRTFIRDQGGTVWGEVAS